MKRTFSLVFALIGALMMVAFVMCAMPQHVPTLTVVDRVDVWLTTGNKNHKLEHQAINFSPGSGSNLQIQVNESIMYQEMEGFGAALTDSAAWVISNTSGITQTKILNDLFSPTDGIGISYVRLPMGATDFTPTVFDVIYTYDDNDGQPDPDLTNFSIARDDADHYNRLSVLTETKKLNPQLKIMGSPWTAPSWMKDNGSPMSGTLLSSHYITYANYFVKFVQVYQDNGVHIDAVTIQNEPYHKSTTRPTMWMEPEQQAAFVKELGQAFDTANITDTKILIWDHNWDRPDYPIKVVSHTGVMSSYIAGSAWHCYDAGNPYAQTLVHNAHPDKDIYFTECSGHYEYSNGQKPDDNFAGDLVWGVHNVAIGAIRNWAKTVLYWNLALDPEGGPSLPGACEPNRCRGLVTISPTGVISYHAEYYIVGHLSKFVDPGAHRIESSYFTGTLESVAFQNPDQSIALVVLNPQTITQTFDVQWHGKYFSYELAPESVATFKWKIHDLYLPLVLNQYRPPVFQKFEQNNGTPGDDYKDIYFADCSLVSDVVHGGVRSLRCRMHGKADGGSNDTGGTVAVYPSSRDPVDLSSGAVFSVWVYDTQGNNTVQLKLCDNPVRYPNHCSNDVWSTMSAYKDQWTEITWPLSSFTGVDQSKITSLQVYEWNDDTYYFDDITWK